MCSVECVKTVEQGKPIVATAFMVSNVWIEMCVHSLLLLIPAANKKIDKCVTISMCEGRTFTRCVIQIVLNTLETSPAGQCISI